MLRPRLGVREPSLLTAEHVTKRFGGHAALQDVSIEIRKNEIVGLLGQNGAGKSTLTKILVGVESIDEGKVTFRGRPFSPRNPIEAAEEGISIAYQDGATVPDLKVYQWMYLGREDEHLRPAEDARDEEGVRLDSQGTRDRVQSWGRGWETAPCAEEADRGRQSHRRVSRG